jgi:thioredoxin 1
MEAHACANAHPIPDYSGCFLTFNRLSDTLRSNQINFYHTRGYYGMADSYIEITSENFTEKVLEASQLVIVNFSSDQSNACQIQEPEFEAVSKEYQGRITFARVNVEGQDELTQQWKVEGIPTMIFFKGGNAIHRINGIMMREKLRRQIEGVLLAN